MADEIIEKKCGKTTGSQAIIDNMVALMNELKMLDDNNSEYSENNKKEQITTMAEKQMNQMDRPPEEEDQIDKSIVESPSNGSTASDSVDVRDKGNLPTLTEENLVAIAKMLQQNNANKSQVIEPVKNTAEKSNDATVLKALETLNTHISTIIERQDVIEKSVESMLRGLGVADEIEKSEKNEQSIVTKNTANKQIRDSSESEQLIEYIKKAIGDERKLGQSSNANGLLDNSQHARKSIGLLLGGLIEKDK